MSYPTKCGRVLTVRVFAFNRVKAWLVSWQAGVPLTGPRAAEAQRLRTWFHQNRSPSSCPGKTVVTRILKEYWNECSQVQDLVEQHPFLDEYVWITVTLICLPDSPTMHPCSFEVSGDIYSNSLCMVKHSSASHCLIDCVYIWGDSFRYCMIQVQWEEINYIQCFYCAAEPPVVYSYHQRDWFQAEQSLFHSFAAAVTRSSISW